jgi:hypothetical protein
VVDVRMREQHEVDLPRIKGPGTQVACAGLAATLEHAAVHQEAHTFGLDQKTRAGHFLRGANEAELHGSPRGGHACMMRRAQGLCRRSRHVLQACLSRRKFGLRQDAQNKPVTADC